MAGMPGPLELGPSTLMKIYIVHLYPACLKGTDDLLPGGQCMGESK